MKKIILLVTLVLAIAIISGYKLSVQNTTASDEFKGINKFNSHESSVLEMHEGSPKILFMLNDDAGKDGRSSYLWWSYQYDSRQKGC
jgi:hypothetical protein